jgi:hypothetical protein
MEANAEFDPARAAKKLLREGRAAALATLMAGCGDPYCSLVVRFRSSHHIAAPTFANFGI